LWVNPTVTKGLQVKKIGTYHYLLTMTPSTYKVNHHVSLLMLSNPHLANLFQYKYLIYNKECTLLTYMVTCKIRIEPLASYTEVILIIKQTIL
jgi:hypothetical protein